MKCPRCGKRRAIAERFPETRMVDYVECLDCGRMEELPPAVKRAFAACKRAITGYDNFLCKLIERVPDLIDLPEWNEWLDAADRWDFRARNAIARAEGKEVKK